MGIYTYGSVLPKPAEMLLELDLNLSVQIAPFSNRVHVQANGGEAWRASLSWRNLSGAKRARLRGRILRMYSGVNVDQLRIPLFQELNYGAYGGTPRLNGNIASGGFGVIDGATASVTNWAIEGDFFKFDGYETLHQFKFSVTTDGAGASNIIFEPPVRENIPDNAILVPHKNEAGNETTELDIVGTLIPPFSEGMSSVDALASGELLTRSYSATFIEDVTQ